MGAGVPALAMIRWDTAGGFNGADPIHSPDSVDSDDHTGVRVVG